jgi:uncharacterized protein (TIGR03083 family)
VWTWWEPQQNVGFVRRRQLIEVAVHGWDARNAVGDPRPIERVVALVGLDEFVEVMVHDLRDDVPAPSPITLVASDSAWTATLFGQPDEVADDRRMTASASDLLLTLWGRGCPPPQIATALAALDLS